MGVSNFNGAMSEYFRMHDYRMMYDYYVNIIQPHISNIPTMVIKM